MESTSTYAWEATNRLCCLAQRRWRENVDQDALLTKHELGRKVRIDNRWEEREGTDAALTV